MSNPFFGQPPDAMDEDSTPRLAHSNVPTTTAAGQSVMTNTAAAAPTDDTPMVGLEAAPSYRNMAGQDGHGQPQLAAGGNAHLLGSQQPFGAHAPQQGMPMGPPMHPIHNDARMSLLGFNTGMSGNDPNNNSMANAFDNFTFDTVDPTTGFPMSAMDGTFGLPPGATAQHPDSSHPMHSATAPPSVQHSPVVPMNPSETNSFPMLNPELMGNMLSFSDLDLNHMSNPSSSLDAASMHFFGVMDLNPSVSAPPTNIAGQMGTATTVGSLPPSSFVSTGGGMEVDNTDGLMAGAHSETPKNLSPSIPAGGPQMHQQQTATGPGATEQLPPHPPLQLPSQQEQSRQQQQQQHQYEQQQPQPSLFPSSAGQLAGSGSATPIPTPTSGVAQSLASSAAAIPSQRPLPPPLATNQGPPATTDSSSTQPATTLASPTGAVGPSTTPVSGPAAPPRAAPKPVKNYYSSSGFDMLRALYYVASRPNPEIAIGPVDLSCAFVVCDATVDDFPIIYVSDNFQHLTGYSSYDILGQNCRFLQAPDGQVQAGSRRKFTDNKAVHHIKQKLLAGRELQQSLINYRKGGKPFLNLLTMIPIPWDDYKDGYKYFIGLQIDIVESPDAISGQGTNSMRIDYTHSSIPQYIWDPPKSDQWDTDHDRTLGMDDVSALLQQFNNKGLIDAMDVGGSDVLGSLGNELYRQTWDKMLLENMDDVVHVLSLKGVFLYLSPSCKSVLEYDSADLVGNSLSSICHPSDIVPVTREMRDTQAGQPINLVFRVRRKRSGYTWFESYGSLLLEQGKGRKCIVLVGRKRPAFALRRCDVDINGGIGDSELWTKMSTSGMILHMSSNARSLLDQQPDALMGTSMQDLMRKESRAGFNRSLEKVRRGIIASCRHEVQHRRGQVLQAMTIFYPGDAEKGQRPTFVLGQTRLFRPSSSRHSRSFGGGAGTSSVSGNSIGESAAASSVAGLEEVGRSGAVGHLADPDTQTGGYLSSACGGALQLGSQDVALAADDNIFGELKTTRCTSWQYELRQMEKANRSLAEELGQLLSNRKKSKRRKGVGNVPRDCANCHTRQTPEWRRGPSGQRDLCNSCGLRWAKQVGRVSPRNSSRGAGGKAGGGGSASRRSISSTHSSPRARDIVSDFMSGGGGGGGSSGGGGRMSHISGMNVARSSSTANVAGWMRPADEAMGGSGSVFPPAPMAGGLEISTMPEIAEERDAT